MKASCVKMRVMEDPLTLVERRGGRGLHGATKMQRAHAISKEGSRGRVRLFRHLPSSHSGLAGSYR